MDRQTLIHKFNKQAKKYAKRRKSAQTNKFRQRIFQDARGKVLEVAIGSGLNYPFYSRNIELTGLDFSPEMLKAAQNAVKNYPFNTIFMQEDVETIEFDENSFDTIVSSGSLCAYQDPLHVLNKFQRWCKPEGKILMMEHGISTNRILAVFQKSLDPLALKVAGCHQNRDISNIVRSSNLKLVREERYMAGYLYLIWAKP
jgi:ubiquinone/menaquinone biosynthesis C-methylase UbiE